MNRDEILNALRTLMVEQLEVQVPEQLQDGHRLYEDLNIDSIMVLQLIVDVEERFEVTVPEEDVDPEVFKTVGSLVAFIQQLQGGGEADGISVSGS